MIVQKLIVLPSSSDDDNPRHPYYDDSSLLLPCYLYTYCDNAHNNFKRSSKRILDVISTCEDPSMYYYHYNDNAKSPSLLVHLLPSDDPLLNQCQEIEGRAGARISALPHQKSHFMISSAPPSTTSTSACCSNIDMLTMNSSTCSHTTLLLWSNTVGASSTRIDFCRTIHTLFLLLTTTLYYCCCMVKKCRRMSGTQAKKATTASSLGNDFPDHRQLLSCSYNNNKMQSQEQQTSASRSHSFWWIHLVFSSLALLLSYCLTHDANSHGMTKHIGSSIGHDELITPCFGAYQNSSKVQGINKSNSPNLLLLRLVVVHSNLLLQHSRAAATWLQSLVIGGGYILIQIVSTCASFSMGMQIISSVENQKQNRDAIKYWHWFTTSSALIIICYSTASFVFSIIHVGVILVTSFPWKCISTQI